MTYEDLMVAWNWRPIRACPGRFVLSGCIQDLTPAELLGTEVGICEFNVANASDPVIVGPLDHGGLISYRKRDGSYVHTLNTKEGFRRKLSQLGISFENYENPQLK